LRKLLGEISISARECLSFSTPFTKPSRDATETKVSSSFDWMVKGEFIAAHRALLSDGMIIVRSALEGKAQCASVPALPRVVVTV
jgi:hypothetical protein